MIDLSGRHVLVTGGSRGIGAATAVMMSRAGARLTLVYRQNRSAAKRVVETIGSLGGTAFAVAGDLRSARDATAVVKRANEELGAIDVLVANAGIWEKAAIEDMTTRLWERTVDTNLKSVFLMCRAVIPSMKKRRRGNLILVSSTAGQRGEAFYSHYAASKGGIIAFTRSLAAELGPHGIRVNCVAPGWVKTDMTEHVFADPRAAEAIASGTPLGRIAQPEDIAGPILFLASDLSAHVHGAVLNVNGGSVLCS